MNKDRIYIGQLDQRISITESVRTTSTTGEKTVVDTEVATAWAKIEDVSGTEDVEGKVLALNVRKYIIRYNPTVAAKQINALTINDAGNLYNIYSTAIIGRKEFMVLKCSKKE